MKTLIIRYKQINTCLFILWLQILQLQCVLKHISLSLEGKSYLNIFWIPKIFPFKNPINYFQRIIVKAGIYLLLYNFRLLFLCCCFFLCNCKYWCNPFKRMRAVPENHIINFAWPKCLYACKIIILFDMRADGY